MYGADGLYGASQSDIAGAVAAYFGCLMLFVVLILALYVFIFWKILTKAGYSGWLSLLNLIGGIGTLIILFLLAFGDWPALKRPTDGYAPPPTGYQPPPAPAYAPPVAPAPAPQPAVPPPVPAQGLPGYSQQAPAAPAPEAPAPTPAPEAPPVAENPPAEPPAPPA